MATVLHCVFLRSLMNAYVMDRHSLGSGDPHSLSHHSGPELHVEIFLPNLEIRTWVSFFHFSIVSQPQPESCSSLSPDFVSKRQTLKGHISRAGSFHAFENTLDF